MGLIVDVRFGEHLVVIRGGGDLATGVASRLHHAGFALVVLELAEPLTVRRTVALSTAVGQGTVDVEDLRAVLVGSPGEAAEVAATGDVAVLVSPKLVSFDPPPSVVVDARLAKSKLDTSLHDAPLVIGLGPGFEAGLDCHVVVETQRGQRLGRPLYVGSAAPNTAAPAVVGGRGAERVIRAPTDGEVRWQRAIGEVLDEAGLLGAVAGEAILAAFAGVVRGLIADGSWVQAGQKIGDLDPRADRQACFEISDKSLAIGGGVLDAIFHEAHRWETSGQLEEPSTP